MTFSTDASTPRHIDLLAAPSEASPYAHLEWARRRGLEGRVIGYRRAAEMLYEAMVSGQRVSEFDTVVFPYAATWRHCVELQLKSVLAQLRAVLDLGFTARHHHKIDVLWGEVRPLILRVSPAEDGADVAAVGRVIVQLADLDWDGQAFRYTERRDGQPTLESLKTLDLAAFHEAMLAVANFLDGADVMLYEHAGMKAEIMSYYADEFGPSWSEFS